MKEHEIVSTESLLSLSMIYCIYSKKSCQSPTLKNRASDRMQKKANYTEIREHIMWKNRSIARKNSKLRGN